MDFKKEILSELRCIRKMFALTARHIACINDSLSNKDENERNSHLANFLRTQQEIIDEVDNFKEE